MTTRAATVLQYVTLFLAAWFVASPDHPVGIAAGAAATGAASLLLLTWGRRHHDDE